MSVCPVPGMQRGAFPQAAPAAGRHPAPLCRPQSTACRPHRAYPARTPGLKAMQKYKKLSGLHNNLPPAVIIFTKRE